MALGWRHPLGRCGSASWRLGWLCGCLVWLGSGTLVQAQNLRFDNRREVAVPDYAFLRIGPFYSNVEFTQRIGYRYTQTDGDADYFYDNDRGRTRDDGSEIPILSTLDFRNYLVISRQADLDISVRVTYRHFPMGTEDNDFDVSLPDEGIGATLSIGFMITPVIAGEIYDNFKYGVNYLDDRGIEDDTGGRRNEYLDNRFGVRFDWLVAKNKNLGLDLSRRDYLTFEEEFEDQDRVEYREQLDYGQQLFSGLVLGGRVTFTQRDYKDDQRLDTTQQDYELYARGASGEGGEAGFQLTDATTVSGSIGVSASGTASDRRSEQTTDDGGVLVAEDSDTNPGRLVMNARASLRTQLTRTLAHAITYERGLRGGYEDAFEEYERIMYNIDVTTETVNVRLYSRYDVVEPSGDDQEGYTDWVSGFDVDYPLTELVTLDGGWSYRRRVDDRSDREEDAITDYTSNRARVGTKIELRKKLSWETYLMREERNSDDEDQSFIRYIFDTALVWRHQF